MNSCILIFSKLKSSWSFFSSYFSLKICLNKLYWYFSKPNKIWQLLFKKGFTLQCDFKKTLHDLRNLPVCLKNTKNKVNFFVFLLLFKSFNYIKTNISMVCIYYLNGIWHNIWDYFEAKIDQKDIFFVVNK